MDKKIIYTDDKKFFKAYAVDMTETIREVHKIHKLSPQTVFVLGKSLMSTVMMEMALLKKSNDKLSIEFDGNGAGGKLFAYTDKKGFLKGYIQNPEAGIKPTVEHSKNIIGQIGKLTVNKDLGYREPVRSIVKIDSGIVEKEIAKYFYESEQYPALVISDIKFNDVFEVEKAGAVMLTIYPQATETFKAFLEFRVEDDIELFNNYSGNPQELIEELLGEAKGKIIYQEDVKYNCNCSREYAKSLISILSIEDIDQLIVEQQAEIECHFCHNVYKFSEKELFEIRSEKIKNS